MDNHWARALKSLGLPSSTKEAQSARVGATNGNPVGEGRISAWQSIGAATISLLKRIVRKAVRVVWLSKRILSDIAGSPAVSRYFATEMLKRSGRATTWRVSLHRRSLVVKRFRSSELAVVCFQREALARQVFKGYAWMPPIILKGRRCLVMPFYADERRLDRVAQQLGPETLSDIARQAGSILLDIFLAGYAHCDFHAYNLLWVGGRLIPIDFEAMQEYPDGCRPAFPMSYDVVGQGLDTPFGTERNCYTRKDASHALQRVLRVPIEDVLAYLRARLKRELVAACGRRPTYGGCDLYGEGKTYSSFSLPYMDVAPSEAQRNSARRLENLRIDEQVLHGRTVLDLRSNVGEMLLEVQKFRPGRCVGVECDNEKVAAAGKVAAYNGLSNVEFVRADIEAMEADSFGGPFDVVFCLALDAHESQRGRLYGLLGQVTSQTLYLEGGRTTDYAEVQSNLLGRGFREARLLGFSDDDRLPENNGRCLVVARK